MAEEDEGAEKTEQPSPRKLDEAARQGNVPRSRDFATALVVIGGVGALYALGGLMAAGAADWFRDALRFDAALLADDERIRGRFAALLAHLLFIVLPVILACAAGALLAPLLASGIRFAPEALAPKFSRLDPVAGLKRIYGTDALIELGHGLLKVALVAGFGIAGLIFAAPRFIGLASEPFEGAVSDGLWLVLRTLVLMSVGLVLLASIDAPLQFWRHQHRLMMTRQELRDELKETEGRPEVKSRIRRMQHEMARARMMDAVPTADVILVNPTHYAVALKYDAARMRAPKLVAKGVDEIARIIRETGAHHGVPVVSSPPLARALYGQVKLDQEIPVKLYAAVAQILGYVHQWRHWRAHGGTMPPVPVVDVPATDVPGA